MSKAQDIEDVLTAELKPAFLEVKDESHMHSVGPGAESHFKVVVVASAFEGKPLLARHRLVNGLVDMPTRNIHALALHTFAPAEWTDDVASQHGLESPDCLGGNGK